MINFTSISGRGIFNNLKFVLILIASFLYVLLLCVLFLCSYMFFFSVLVSDISYVCQAYKYVKDILCSIM